MRKYITLSAAVLLLFLTIISKQANAQFVVTANQTADSLAKTLAGVGVTVMNATLNCPNDGSGTFAGMGGNLMIDTGLILTSGTAVEVSQPNGGFGGTPSASNGAPGDVDLNTVLSNTTTYDACILEFDFVPAGDTVKFDYVFASAEYQSYSCSSFNDVFGFFISGPGYATPYNMAKIPGTNIPVCVNSTTGVNTGAACTNMGPGSPFSQYYVDNAGGPTVNYYGFTTVFQAIGAVVPCDTYHLKLAIADGSDGSLDSGVFLKAGSLNSIGLTITGENGGGQIDAENHSVRGCKPGKFKFQTISPQPAPLTIHFDIGGSAINGNDYTFIPDSVIIPTGQTSVELEIHGIHNGTYNGPENVILTVYSPYLCGNGQPNVIATDTLIIYDSLYATPSVTPNGICPGDSVFLTETIADGLELFWTPAPLCSNPDSTSTWVYPTAPTNFVAHINQIGAPATCPDVLRTFFVHVDPIPNIVIPDDDITLCMIDSMDLPVDVLPDTVQYTFLWTPATGLRSPTIGYNYFYTTTPGDYNFTINAYSPLGCPGSKDMHVEVLPTFQLLNVTPDTTINYGDKIQLNAEGGLIYQWSPPRWIQYANEPNPMVDPHETTTYSVYSINQYGCRDSAEVTVTVKYEPESMMPNVFSPNGDGLNDRFKVEFLRDEKILQFAIFNRYGQLIYEDDGTNKGWDGTFNGEPAAADVYHYILKLTSPRNVVRTFKSDVTLTR